MGEDYSQEVLRKEWNAYGMLRSLGWGAGYRTGKQITIFKKYFLETELNFVKHDKEVKGKNINFPFSKDFVYGKLSRMNVLRIGYGEQQTLNFKPYWGGTEVRFNYFGGFSLALTSPIYLTIYRENVNENKYNVSVEKYNPEIHNLNNIYGNGPLGKGWFEFSAYPGFYLKTSLSFEFGSNERKVRSLEVGALLDAYPIPIKIMAFNQPQNFFYAFYLSLHFGVRKDYY